MATNAAHAEQTNRWTSPSRKAVTFAVSSILLTYARFHYSAAYHGIFWTCDVDVGPIWP